MLISHTDIFKLDGTLMIKNLRKVIQQPRISLYMLRDDGDFTELEAKGT